MADVREYIIDGVSCACALKGTWSLWVLIDIIINGLL